MDHKCRNVRALNLSSLAGFLDPSYQSVNREERMARPSLRTHSYLMINDRFKEITRKFQENRSHEPDSSAP
jgi:hypothetical protein